MSERHATDTAGDQALDLEAADPHCLRPEQADLLLRGAPWRRMVVMGDSVAEGLGDPAAGYAPLPWADRVAAALSRRQPGFTYHNLGLRDLRAAEVRERQLVPARALAPDLALVACGGNDVLGRRFDAARVEDELSIMVAALRDANAEVLLLTLFDITKVPGVPAEVGGPLGERLAQLASHVRKVAVQHGALVADTANHPAAADPGIYSADARHVNSRGHAIAAAVVLHRLGWYLGNRPPV